MSLLLSLFDEDAVLTAGFDKLLLGPAVTVSGFLLMAVFAD